MRDQPTVSESFEWGRIPSGVRERYAYAMWTLADDFGGDLRNHEAVRPWREAMERHGLPAVEAGVMSHIVNAMEKMGWIAREGGGGIGKRTTRVSLLLDELPPCPFARADTTVNETSDEGGEAAATPNGAPLPPPINGESRPSTSVDGWERPTVEIDAVDALKPPYVESFNGETIPVIGIPDIDSPETIAGKLVAISSMATEVMFSLASLVPPKAGVDDAMAERLAWTLDENARLREKLRRAEQAAATAQDTARAHAAAVAAARKQNLALQANVAALLKGERIDDRAWKELERMVREAPRSTKTT